MAETEKERADRERREKEQQQQRQREQQEREKNAPSTRKPATKTEGEQGKVGEPMREDDLMNQFRAPDVKPLGAFYGEDISQFGPGPTEEQVIEPPPETHPQKPGTQVSREEEEELLVIKR